MRLLNELRNPSADFISVPGMANTYRYIIVLCILHFTPTEAGSFDFTNPPDDRNIEAILGESVNVTWTTDLTGSFFVVLCQQIGNNFACLDSNNTNTLFVGTQSDSGFEWNVFVEPFDIGSSNEFFFQANQATTSNSGGGVSASAFNAASNRFNVIEGSSSQTAATASTLETFALVSSQSTVLNTSTLSPASSLEGTFFTSASQTSLRRTSQAMVQTSILRTTQTTVRTSAARTPQVTSTPSTSNGSSNDKNMIIGLSVIGSFLLILLIYDFIQILRRKRKRRSQIKIPATLVGSNEIDRNRFELPTPLHVAICEKAINNERAELESQLP